MISTTQAICLAVIQGITEFLPVSSSGHLVLFPALFGWPDQGQAFDVAVHLGSLIAVIWYFNYDVKKLCFALPKLIAGRSDKDTQLLLFLMVATIPVLLVGFLAQSWISNNLRNPLIISATMLGFGLLLWYADSRRGHRHLSQLDMRSAIYIGIAQILALIPGTSRSGITMSMAMLLGYDREHAARFSFLLSIPVIAAASAYKLLQFTQHPPESWGVFSLAVIVSFFSALLAIKWFLQLIEKIGVLPFVFYRLILSVVILVLYW